MGGFHDAEPQAGLHGIRLPLSGSGSPIGSVTPPANLDGGVFYKDIQTDIMWVSNGPTSSDWQQFYVPPSGPPVAHASTHKHGGSDEVATATPTANSIPKTGATTKLDAWVSSAAAAGTPSLRALGATATDACAGNDARLSNARTPTSHAASHKHGGSDEVATATPAANAIPKANGSGKLDAWITAPVFGSGFARKATASFATSNTAPTVADTFTPGSGLTGTYRLGFRAEMNSNTGGIDWEAEIRRTDGTPTRIAYGEDEPADDDNWATFAYFEHIVLSGASPAFDLRINGLGGNTVTAARIRWEWWRVA